MKKQTPHLEKLIIPQLKPPPRVNLEDYFTMTDEFGKTLTISACDLEKVVELGRGAYGVVEKMVHKLTGRVFAVKRIHASIHDESQKRMFVELDVCMKSDRCANLVRFYGAMLREGDVWICMEVMDISLDKFYRMCVDLNQHIPELFIAKIAISVVEGLNFMKDQMNLIHRDVKPSNILLNLKGEVKLCDFGISGHLTNSVAKTVNAGCKPYMPPERIEGEAKDAYGVQADVWSLGITLVEIASGAHPYSRWKTPFEQLKQVVQEAPPRVDQKFGYSDSFHDFVELCLIKEYLLRPKCKELFEHPFLVISKQSLETLPPIFDPGEFIASILKASNVDCGQIFGGLKDKEKEEKNNEKDDRDKEQEENDKEKEEKETK